MSLGSNPFAAGYQTEVAASPRVGGEAGAGGQASGDDHSPPASVGERFAEPD
ncbi:MAG TPA: hypothetical protein VFQ96_00030 [Microbacteriaceae bacterium]|nr:hypothetical protein [Microbacteriaceae bacterium]